MFKNYLITAFRNLSRNKSYTIINITSLSIGISCTIIAYLMVNYMTGFDIYHSKRDRIYRIVTKTISGNKEDSNPGVPIPMKYIVKDYFPEIDKVSLINNSRGGLISALEQKQTTTQIQLDKGIVFTDDNFYQILDRTWLEGNPMQGLTAPNSALISESLAKDLFPGKSALNQIINLDGKHELKITGVLEDQSQYETDFYFKLLISLSTNEKDYDAEDWGNLSSDIQCFVLMKNSISPEDMEDRMQELVKANYDLEDFEAKFHPFQPLADIHFNRNYSSFHNTVSPGSIIALILVALFLIITASINFVNLATAQAVKRSREVGVRKVLGGFRKQIQAQFLIETMIISFFAIILSLGIAELLLIKANGFLELNLEIGYTTNGKFWLFILLLWLGTSFLSGAYPAFVLSRFNPIMALKNSISSSQVGGAHLRLGLVIFQFVISQVLIIGVIVIMYQIYFLRNNDMGFEKDAILTVYLPNKTTNSRKAFIQQIQQIPAIFAISSAMDTPASNSVWRSNFTLKTDSTVIENDAQIKLGDANYLDTYGIRLLAGRNYQPSDTVNGFLINETLLKLAGFNNPEEAIGKQFKFGWNENYYPITGVVRNFHSTSFRNEINPTVICQSEKDYDKVGMKLNSGNVNHELVQMEKIFKSIYPGYSFEYRFMDEIIERFYRGERKMYSVLRFLTMIAIFIGCLGLYGLVSYMTNQKVKEIGIRKVLGASFVNIIAIFSKEFARLVSIAFIIALPLAYFGMNAWLQDFTYKVSMEWWIFLTALLVTIVLVIITVGYTTIKSALTNPVHCLKSE